MRYPLLLLCGLGLAPTGLLADDTDPATELDPITVTASPFDREADELAQPVDVLYGEELERRRAGTLGETLDGQPGISSADFGPGVGRPVIRGQGGPRVLLLENGASSMDASAISGDHAVAIDPAHAEQIEIIKGPATLIYGSAAAAGVINVVNGRLPREVIPGVHGSLRTDWRDNAARRSGSLDLSAGIGEYVLRLDLSGLDAGDIEIPGFAELDPAPGEEPEGRLQNSSVTTGSGALTAGWVTPERVLALSLSRLHSNYGIPEGHHDDGGDAPVTADGAVRILLEQTRVDARGEWLNLGPIERIRSRIGVNDYRHTELEGAATGTVFDISEAEARVELTHAPIGDWRGVFGLQLNDRDYAAIGDEAFVPPVRSRSAGLFLVEEYPLGDDRLELGARVERLLHRADANPDRNFTPLSLSAGYVRRLDPWHHLRLTASRSQRAPAAEELYSYGPHLATRSFERGASGLSVETANNLELGLDRHERRWSWQVSLFANFAQDYVYQSEVDAGLNADGSGTAARDGRADRVDEDGRLADDGELLLVDYRQDDARLYGLEVETRLRFGDGPRALQLRLFGDTVRGRISGGPNLPRITPTRLGAGLSAGLGPVLGNVELTRVFEQDRVSPLETPTGGHTLLGVDFDWPVPGRTPVNLYLRGRNLLDEDLRRHTSFVKDIAPLPGRSVLIGASWEFDL